MGTLTSAAPTSHRPSRNSYCEHAFTETPDVKRSLARPAVTRTAQGSFPSGRNGEVHRRCLVNQRPVLRTAGNGALCQPWTLTEQVSYTLLPAEQGEPSGGRSVGNVCPLAKHPGLR